MTTTITEPEQDTEPEVEPKPRKRPTPHPCGWCGPAFGQPPGCYDQGDPPRCKGTYRNGVPAHVSADRLWHCSCADTGHEGRRAA